MRLYPLFLAVLFFTLGSARAHSATPTHEVLHAFTRGPGYPGGSGLVPDSNGYLWGVASWGGAYNEGAVYKVKVDGSDWQIVHSFGVGGQDYPDFGSSGPSGTLVNDGEGYMWGTLRSERFDQHGSIFKVDVSTGTVTTVVEFTGNSGDYKGTTANGPLVDDGAGNLIGTTYRGGAYDSGTIFKINRASSAFTTLLEFGGVNKGSDLSAGLARDNAGNFWGTTRSGSPLYYGTIFKFNPSTGVLNTIVEFTGTSGANRGSSPEATLLDDGAGSFWGMTRTGGTNNEGTVFKVNIDTGVMTTMIDFTRDGSVYKGAFPCAGLVSDGKGSFWGSTRQGGTEDFGTIFKINAATGVLITVADFTQAANAGKFPESRLVADGTGNLWGTSGRGGIPWGDVYKINVDTGELTGVLTFDGDGPENQGSPSTLLSDGAGSLWSTTYDGGNFDAGTILQLNERTRELTTLVEFSGVGGTQKGINPGELMSDESGNLWGTTYSGGAANLGTVYKYSRTSGQLTTVVEFGGNIRGAYPVGRLARDGVGYVWGTTTYTSDDYNTRGTIFKVNEASGELTTVVEFTGEAGTHKGWAPVGELVADGEGYFWGVTRGGGFAQCGTIFKVEIATGELTTMWEFAGVGDNPGSWPLGLVSDGMGAFIGTTARNDVGFWGTIFKIDAHSGQFTTIFEFDGFPGGNNYEPSGALVSDGTGSFWGATSSGGLHGHGTVFKFNATTRELTTVVHFTGSGDQPQSGSRPGASLILNPNGDLYGTTDLGGPGGGGTIFRIRGAVPRQLAQGVLHVAGPRGKGSAVPGEPEGTTFVSVGEPAVDRRTAAFLATIRNADGKQVSALFAGNGIAARAGQTAPGAEPAVFKSFDEPLASWAGIAFGAKLNDGRSGIWTTAFTGQLALVELNKSAAPGFPGSKIASIMSYSLRGAEIVALLKLQLGQGGVTRANDTVLARYVTGGESRLLSKGQNIQVNDVVPQPLLTLSAFTPSPLAPGQDRGHAEGVVGAKGKVRLADRTVREVVLRAKADGTVEVMQMTRPPVRGSAEFLAKGFGFPAAGAAQGVAYVAMANGRTATRDQAIETDLAESLSEGPALAILEGDHQAPGAEPAVFRTMSDPIVNDQQQVAFVASLQGEGVTAKNNRGLWWGGATGVNLVARLGDHAPDRDGNAGAATFAKIERIGLPDGPDAGPLFVATIAGQRSSGVTGRNNRALYGRDSNGKLRELLRTGDKVSYGDEEREVRSFTALSGGKPVGGRRAFTTAGSVAARVIFTDHTTSVIRIVVP